MSARRYRNTEDGMEDDDGIGPGWDVGERREYVKAKDYEALAAAILGHFQMYARVCDRMFATQEAGGGFGSMIPTDAEREEMKASHDLLFQAIGPELAKRFLKIEQPRSEAEPAGRS